MHGWGESRSGGGCCNIISLPRQWDNVQAAEQFNGRAMPQGETFLQQARQTPHATTELRA